MNLISKKMEMVLCDSFINIVELQVSELFI